MSAPTLIRSNTGAQTIARPVVAVILAAALLLIVLRLLAPFQVGSDQGTQIEAAHRFANGLGITTTNDAIAGPDIVELPEPRPVTWWPPGFSVALGGLLAAGLPLLFALKLLFSGTTLVGWLGWGLLAEHFLVPLPIGNRVYPVHLLVSACLPILLTPRWSLSDIFLWAGVPYVILLLARRPAKGGWRFDAAAGCLLGVLIGFRYAAAFPAPVAMLMLIQFSWPSWKATIRRAVLLGAAALLVIVPLVWFLQSAAESTGGQVLPGVATAGGENVRKASFLTGLKWVMEQSPAVWYLFPGLSLFVPVMVGLRSLAGNVVIGGAGILTVLWLPFAATRLSSRHIALSVSFIPVGLLAFLALVNKGLFFSINRYYQPAVLAVVFLVFAIAACSRIARVPRLLATGIAGGIILYLVAYPAVALLWSEKRRAQVIEGVLGYTPARQPGRVSTSLAVQYPAPFLLYGPKEATRRRIFELHRLHPDALWFVQNYGIFVYDAALQAAAPVPGVNMRVFPSAKYWQSAFTSRPVRIFAVMHGDYEPAFMPSDHRQVVYEDRWEQSRIFAAEFAAGHAFHAGVNQIGASPVLAE